MLKKSPLNKGTKSLKSGRGLKKSALSEEDQRKKRTEDLLENRKMQEFFLSCWDKRVQETGENPRCYETGVKLNLGHRLLSTCYHHILLKSIYPQFKYEYWNICFLLPKIHEQVETNISFCPRVEELTKQTKIERL